MPTAYIKKLAREGKGSVESLEKKWDEAKSKAKEEGKAEDYALITHIFQSSLGIANLKAESSTEKANDMASRLSTPIGHKATQAAAGASDNERPCYAFVSRLRASMGTDNQ